MYWTIWIVLVHWTICINFCIGLYVLDYCNGLYVSDYCVDLYAEMMWGGRWEEEEVAVNPGMYGWAVRQDMDVLDARASLDPSP